MKVLGEGRISLQTENANLGRTISPREISDLPSLTRSPYDFIAIVPGASLSNDQIGVGFNVNGGRTQSANYLLDGGENNETSMSAPALDVPLDALQEFSVQTNHFSAEYGRNSGFIANLATKSGTNAFHGSLYDYIRNSAFAANTFDNNAHSLPTRSSIATNSVDPSAALYANRDCSFLLPSSLFLYEARDQIRFMFRLPN